MFNIFKILAYRMREYNMNKEVESAYCPAFKFHDRLLTVETFEIGKQLGLLKWLEKEFQKEEGKSEARKIRDKWKAIELGPIIKHYEDILVKLDELIETIPAPPDLPPAYKFILGLGDDDDLS